MIAGLKPYPEMRDSGSPWLGQTPQHWPLQRLKTLVREISEKGFPERPLLAATQSMGVVRKDRFPARTVTAQGDLALLKHVKVDDFVVSLRSFEGGIETAHDEGIISPAYTVLRAASAEHHGYLARLFKCEPFLGAIRLAVTGIREGQNVDYDRLRDEPVCVPPPEDRAAIVRFLRHFDRRFRRSITAKQKMISLLEEQKAAIVHQAVTRGLNPDATMKRSGVDWLGDIPAHWDVIRVKDAFENLNTRRVPLSATARGAMTLRAFDYYGASGVIDQVDEYLFDEDLLLIAEDGANLVLRNLPLAIVARGKFWVNNHAHILRPIRGDLDYLASYMEGLDYRPWITGAAQPKLTQDRLMAIKIAVAPAEEQRAIISAVRQHTSGLSAALSLAKQEVKLLQEYSARLIGDVVTGKLDVRPTAALLADVVEVTAPPEDHAAFNEEGEFDEIEPEEEGV